MSEFVLHSYIPSLERDLVRDKDQVDELLCDYYADEAHRALTDPGIEYSNPSEQLQYLLTITHILGGESEQDFVAAYSAYHFAVSLAGLLDWPVPGPHAAMSDFDYLPKDASHDVARSMMIERAAAYLADRPELDSVIGCYAADYAQMADGSFSQGAQVLCALTCERIEQYGVRASLLAEQHLN